jgi:alpha-glucosidase (family GH31 glycosyl hydrolase)
MAEASNKKWFGVFTNLAQAQDWSIWNHPETGVVDITMRATGGIGEIFFLFGDQPNDVLKMYQSAILGRPTLLPKWALGWHVGQRGYSNTDALRENLYAYGNHSIPLDAQWLDVDYMHEYRNFEIEQ